MKFTMTLAVSVESTEEEAENTCNRSNEVKKKSACNTERVKVFVTISQIYVTDGGLF